MNQELELKLQSYLDGELSERQARKIASWLASDAEAQSLFAELQMTKAALNSGELDVKLPEGPAFYWSKIQGEIERGEQTQPRPMPDLLSAWRRLLAPLAGVALVAFLTVYTFKMYETGDDPRHHAAIVENLSENTGTYSFRSQSEKMFVVWLYDRSGESDAEGEQGDEQFE